jgi:translation initiation factor 4E
MWEDAANARGGKFLLRMKKAHVNRVWEEMCLAVISDRFHVGDELCGIVLVTKAGEDIISVWTKNNESRQALLKIRDGICKVLNIPPTVLEYRPHDLAIQNMHMFARMSGGFAAAAAHREARDRERSERTRAADAAHGERGERGDRAADRVDRTQLERSASGGNDRDSGSAGDRHSERDRPNAFPERSASYGPPNYRD